MKVIINECYGGFGICQSWAKDHCKEDCCPQCSCRECPKLIQAIEDGISVNEVYSNLRVAEIPDETTDYKIMDNDGYETLLYALYGKIYTF